MQYMVIEHFKPGKVAEIYRRLESEGRRLPDGLHYVGSWIVADLSRCYQVMECEDAALLEAWMAQWSDLTDFEVIPVLSSAEAKAKALAEE